MANTKNPEIKYNTFIHFTNIILYIIIK